MFRTEAGYCGIEWKTSSGTSIDAFAIFSTAITTQAISAGLAVSLEGNNSTSRHIFTFLFIAQFKIKCFLYDKNCCRG